MAKNASLLEKCRPIQWVTSTDDKVHEPIIFLYWVPVATVPVVPVPIYGEEAQKNDHPIDIN
jgi:hypothetical protein